MLFKRAVLDGLATGEVDLAFRRWEAARVHTGTVMRTRIGVVEVTDIAIVGASTLTEHDARRAGYTSLDRLRRDIDARDGTLFRIELHRIGDDPRIALRSDVPDADTLADLVKRVGRMGDWAVPTLELIAAEPGVRAADLAARMGREKLPFKASVRRLKELGLTESLPVGYRLSARGEVVLAEVRAESGKKRAGGASAGKRAAAAGADGSAAAGGVATKAATRTAAKTAPKPTAKPTAETATKTKTKTTTTTTTTVAEGAGAKTATKSTAKAAGKTATTTAAKRAAAAKVSARRSR